MICEMCKYVMCISEVKCMLVRGDNVNVLQSPPPTKTRPEASRSSVSNDEQPMYPLQQRLHVTITKTTQKRGDYTKQRKQTHHTTITQLTPTRRDRQYIFG